MNINNINSDSNGSDFKILGLEIGNEIKTLNDILNNFKDNPENINDFNLTYKFRKLKYINGKFLVLPENIDKFKDFFIVNNEVFYNLDDSLYITDDNGLWINKFPNSDSIKFINGFYVVKSVSNRNSNINEYSLFDSNYNRIGNIKSDSEIINIINSEDEYIVEIKEQYRYIYYSRDKESTDFFEDFKKLEIPENLNSLLDYQDLGVKFGNRFKSEIIPGLREKTGVREMSKIQRLTNGQILLFCENPKNTSAEGYTGELYIYNPSDFSLSEKIDFTGEVSHCSEYDICEEIGDYVLVSLGFGKSLAYLNLKTNELVEIKNEYYTKNYRVLKTDNGYYLYYYYGKERDIYKVIVESEGLKLERIGEASHAVKEIESKNGLLIGTYATYSSDEHDYKQVFVIKDDEVQKFSWIGHNSEELCDFKEINKNGEIYYAYTERNDDEKGTTKIVSEKEFYKMFGVGENLEETQDNTSKNVKEIIEK